MAGPSPSPPERSLWQVARVTNVLSATQFQAPRLTEYPDTYFNNWTVFVLHDVRSTPGAIAAPQGEQQVASASLSLGGTVTHPVFTVPMIAGDDIILLHPDISTVVAAGIAAILAAIGPAGMNQGLVYYGVVTAVPGVGQFTIPTLAGLGANKFIDTGLVNQYYAFVFRDAAGGIAPQGENRPITGYATLTGNFVVNPNFTVAVTAGDEILIIHPFLARIMNLYGLPPVTGSIAHNWNAAEADVVSLGTANVRNKLHSLILSIHNLVGTIITIRLYMLVTGTERLVYRQTFNATTEPFGCWIVNGTLGIHEVLRCTLQSNNAADNAKAVDFDYMLEAM